MKIVRLGSRLSRLLAAALLLGLAVAAPAQTTGDIDPPGRVGRIADAEGQTWLYSPETGEWIAAALNRPVTTGDHFATDRGARAELTVGSTSVRLDGATEIEVVRLDDAAVALHLHSGAIALRVRDARAVGELELTTAEGRMSVQSAGRYRIDRGDRATEVTVEAGQAQWEAPGNALTLYPGQRGQFWIDPNGSAQYAIVEPVRDAFAAWNQERDRAFDQVPVAPYVSPEMTGAQDLARYGRWDQSPEYGAIWYPAAVPVGWAPYTVGHWAWVAPWGWTWVDDAPWGFAPFHYGRWVFLRGAWCWVPGRYVPRPVYAPALVAWVGGTGASVAVSIGGAPAVGWVPLAPREVYVPAFRAAPRYLREVNVTHVTNITNITTIVNNPPSQYRNWNAPHAVTVVPTSVLERREPVAPQAARARELPAVRAFVQAPPPRPVAMLAPPVAPAPLARAAEPRPPAPPGFAPRPERAEDARRRIPERPAAALAPAAPAARNAPPPPNAAAVRPAEAPLPRPAAATPAARAGDTAAPPADGRRGVPRPPGREERMSNERREAAPRAVPHEVAPPPRSAEAPRAEAPRPPEGQRAARPPEGARPAEAPRAAEARPTPPARAAEARPAPPAHPAEAHPPAPHPPQPEAPRESRDERERSNATR
jgi:hypothetical protein